MTKTAIRAQPFNEDIDRELAEFEAECRTNAVVAQSLGGYSQVHLILTPNGARALARCIARGRRAETAPAATRSNVRFYVIVTIINVVLTSAIFGLALLRVLS